MGWAGHLQLRYEHTAGRTVARDRHDGPLRVLQSLYPEGDAICHQVLVHPPGGLVGGDTLTLDVQVQTGAHALVTTPGATRFYRSLGEVAAQQVTLRLDEGARMEWLPLETIAYPACQGRNALDIDMARGSRLIGWDVLALGLPASDQPFDRGRFEQCLSLRGVWLERGVIDAVDRRLLDSPVGWDGHRVLATLFALAGERQSEAGIDALLEAARAVSASSGLSASAGATALAGGRGVVLRVLAPRVEPALQLLQSAWGAWRPPWLGCPSTAPRIWRM